MCGAKNGITFMYVPRLQRLCCNEMDRVKSGLIFVNLQRIQRFFVSQNRHMVKCVKIGPYTGGLNLMEVLRLQL